MNDSNNIFNRLVVDYRQPKVVIFLLFVFSIIAVSSIFFALSVGRPYMGVTLSMNDQGWTVESVDPNGVTRQAGINKGDRLIEINGQSADTFLEKYKKSGLVSSTVIRELTVVDSNGKLKSATLQDGVLTLRGLIRQTSWLFISLLFWAVGFYVLWKKPRYLASSLLCLIGLIIGLMLSANLAWTRGISIGAYFDVLSTTIGPWLLLHFFLILPDERTTLRNNNLVCTIYFPAVVTLVLFLLIGYPDGQPLSWFRNVRYLEAGIAFLAATGVAIFNYFSATSIKTRQQMKIVAVACFAAVIPSVFLSLIPQSIMGQSILPSEFTVLTFIFIPIGMGYAIVTQKLMDIDVFIRRGMIYALITLVMAAILSAGITIVVAVSNGPIGIREKVVIGLVSGFITTVLFGPVRNGIETMVDRLFYKDRYDYRQIMQSLSISLNSAIDFNDISRLVVGATVHTLNLAGSCLFVKTQSGSVKVSASQGTFLDAVKQNQLLNLISQRTHTIEFPNMASTVYPDLAFLIPLIAGEKEVGILCLSPKVTRQDFSSDDIYLLQEIASLAAISLHSARLTRDVSMRDTFVSVASHELRTPLTSIMGYTDLLLRRDPPSDTRKRWLQNIFDSSQRVSTMLDDLLNISRIHSGKIAIKLEKVGLYDILKETLSLTKESTSKHEFITDIEPNLPDVLVDRDKLGQVVGNLLSNAVKYSPNGGRITIAANNERSDHHIILSIIDEGIGISPEDKGSLFTTFHRIQRPETKSIRGSGLGLYIAKEWTEAMGGKIWFESELNKGSTFFIAIPTQGSNKNVLESSSIRGKCDPNNQKDTDSRR